jgi:hypothetical protein
MHLFANSTNKIILKRWFIAQKTLPLLVNYYNCEKYQILQKELYLFYLFKESNEITIIILVCQCLLKHFLNSTVAIVSALQFTG